jgi:hypothetical protein
MFTYYDKISFKKFHIRKRDEWNDLLRNQVEVL